MGVLPRGAFPPNFQRPVAATLYTRPLRIRFQGARMVQTSCRPITMPSSVGLGLRTPPGSKIVRFFCFFCPLLLRNQDGVVRRNVCASHNMPLSCAMTHKLIYSFGAVSVVVIYNYIVHSFSCTGSELVTCLINRFQIKQEMVYNFFKFLFFNHLYHTLLF